LHGLIGYGAVAANHELVWQGQRQRVDALGRQLHDWSALRSDYVVASGSSYSRRLGLVGLTRVRIGPPKRPHLYLVTNDMTCTPSQAWQCKRNRWPVEELFRDEKQVVKLAGCQSSRVDAHKAQLALVLLAWVVLECLRQARSQTTGAVQAALVQTVWGHVAQFSAPVSDLWTMSRCRRQPNTTIHRSS
jgi:Transposase DDE domain